MDFGNNIDPKKKIITDSIKLARLINDLREICNHKIVVTIGTWDMLHIGHVRYLIKAKSHGDILVVGYDTDRAVKLYKGELRPIIPENERVEMLTYQSCVNFATPVDDINKHGLWGYSLIKKIKPDVFVAVEDSYPKKQLREIRKYCKGLIVLPRQAENTSTSKVIQDTVKKTLISLMSELEKR